MSIGSILEEGLMTRVVRVLKMGFVSSGPRHIETPRRKLYTVEVSNLAVKTGTSADEFLSLIVDFIFQDVSIRTVELVLKMAFSPRSRMHIKGRRETQDRYE